MVGTVILAMSGRKSVVPNASTQSSVALGWATSATACE